MVEQFAETVEAGLAPSPSDGDGEVVALLKEIRENIGIMEN